MASLKDSEMEILNKKPMWVYPKSLGLSPSQRWGHSACYFHGVVYIFGGCCGGLHFSDVLALNLTTMTWTTLATTGPNPGPRDSHTAIVADHKMLVFGGTDGTKKLNDLHTLDLLSKEWSKPLCNGTPPNPRESHTCTLIDDNRMIIFGGSGEGDGNYLNDLYVLDLKSMRWSSLDVKGEVPFARDSHGCVSIGSKMFVYGGDCGDRYNGDVYVLDTFSMTWSKMVIQGPLPGVRAGHAMVNVGTQVYVVGGVGDKCYYNDVWLLDTINNKWTQLNVHGQKPRGRFSHTAIVTNSDIAIYGGCGEDERPLDELILLKFGACQITEQLSNRSVSTCKMYRRHWNGKRRFLRGFENNSGTTTTMLYGNNVEVSERKRVHEIDELESKQSVRYGLDMLHSKRMRKINSKNLDMEIEVDESVQHNQPQLSSSSHSDQEQVPLKTNVLDPISHGFPMFKHRNNLVTRNSELHEPVRLLSPVNRISRSRTSMEAHQPAPTRKQFARDQPRIFEGMSSNMVGSDVHGKVDGEFDSGYLMTAVVNGKIFRGVLFSPMSPTAPLSGNPVTPSPSSMTANSIPVAVPIIPYTSSFETSYLNSTNGGIRRQQQHLQHLEMSCPRSIMSKGSSQGININEKLRCDLEGVVLSLGGPGSSLKDC